MIKIDYSNRMDIIRSYVSKMLESMSPDDLYSFVYHTMVDNKNKLNNTMLQQEIVNSYPDILEEWNV